MLLFITLAAMITVTVTLMPTQLFTSISSMYETANPPHFLQMHKGEFSQSDIDEFNRGYTKNSRRTDETAGYPLGGRSQYSSDIRRTASACRRLQGNDKQTGHSLWG